MVIIEDKKSTVILWHDDRRNIHNKMLCVNDNNHKKIEPVELQMVKYSKPSLTPTEREMCSCSLYRGLAVMGQRK